jgi:integrase
LPRKTDHLFPSFVRIKNNHHIGDDGKLGEINKKCLIKAGLPYDDFPPNHIFRHTFAQEFLASANWNYELTASIGGWGSSHTLKRHYGAIGTDPKINGLRKAMGEKIEETRSLLIF